MKKILIMALLLIPGLFLAGCASTGDKGDMKAAPQASASTTSYQSGHSTKLSSKHHKGKLG